MSPAAEDLARQRPSHLPARNRRGRALCTRWTWPRRQAGKEGSSQRLEEEGEEEERGGLGDEGDDGGSALQCYYLR